MTFFGFLRIRPKTLPAGLFLRFFPQMATQTKPFPQKPQQNTKVTWRKHGTFSKNTKQQNPKFRRNNVVRLRRRDTLTEISVK
jgi:hypothetical protein